MIDCFLGQDFRGPFWGYCPTELTQGHMKWEQKWQVWLWCSSFKAMHSGLPCHWSLICFKKKFLLTETSDTVEQTPANLNRVRNRNVCYFKPLRLTHWIAYCSLPWLLEIHSAECQWRGLVKRFNREFQAHRRLEPRTLRFHWNKTLKCQKLELIGSYLRSSLTFLLPKAYLLFFLPPSINFIYVAVINLTQMKMIPGLCFYMLFQLGTHYQLPPLSESLGLCYWERDLWF